MSFYSQVLTLNRLQTPNLLISNHNVAAVIDLRVNAEGETKIRMAVDKVITKKYSFCFMVQELQDYKLYEDCPNTEEKFTYLLYSSNPSDCIRILKISFNNQA